MPSNYPAHRLLPMQRPNPSALGRVLESDEVDGHRSVGCPHYEDCLDHACKAGWAGWSCVDCPLHVPAATPTSIERGDGGTTNPRIGVPPSNRNAGRVGAILAVIEKGREYRAAEVAAVVGGDPLMIAQELGRITRDGRLRRVGRGLYAAAP